MKKTQDMIKFEITVFPELQKAFKLPLDKIYQVCMNLPQNVAKLRFPN